MIFRPFFPTFASFHPQRRRAMTTTRPPKTAFLFDDKSAVEAFIKNGWLEKVAEDKTKDEVLCRYTPKGMEFRAVISRFEAN